MDEETRALQERRALKQSQRQACTGPTFIHSPLQPTSNAKENISKTKKRTRALFDEPNHEKIKVPELKPSQNPAASQKESGEAWFLSFAKEHETVHALEVTEDESTHSNDFLEVYGPKTWDSIYEFSKTVSFVNGPRNQYRSQKFSSLLDTLLDYVKNWKLQKVPLMLQG